MFKFLLLTCLGVFGYVLGEDGPTVRLKQGNVQGIYQTSYKGRKYSAFEGIPYAKSPIGELRFKPPQKAEGWDDLLYANKSYTCMSFLPFPIMHGVRGTEDCLYMYVYVPRETIDENENLNVVIHIHGGAFMFGSPKFLAGPRYVMDKDFILVTMNYRLGVLGFMSTEDDVVSGNNGLKDQSLALKWIKENIKSFGGNPDSITLTGQSAGAASVHYHYLSSMSRGLFHKGFSQSGTALNHWALNKEPLNKTRTLAKLVGCPNDDTQVMVDCFRGKTGKEVVGAIKDMFVFIDAVPFVLFGPVIEKGSNPFLEDHPYKLLKEGKIYDVPWITSHTQHEGLVPAGFFSLLNKLEELDSRWDELSPYMLDIINTVDDSDKPEVIQKVRNYYLKDKPLTKDNIYDLVQIFTDRTYVIDGEKAIRLHAKGASSPVYYYIFSYIIEQTFLYPGIKKGVSHCDDTRLMFRMIVAPDKLELADEQLMEAFTTFLSDYASAGAVTFKGVDWRPVVPSSDEINYLHIQSPDDIAMKSTKELGPNEFWNSLPIRENEKLN